MHAAVTGAYGHLGANLVRSLLDDGVSVRAVDIARGASLDGLDVEHVEADVLDPDSLLGAFEGVDAVFHLAAMVSVTGDPTGRVWKVNVDGAHNAARAALEKGVRRFVHCSSAHAYDIENCGPSLDEEGPRSVRYDAPVYDRSKYAGEQRVRSVIEDGLDAVIVNPTGIVGPHDYAPSRMGETILRFRDGAIPVNIGGGFDFVDVRDLAAGMRAAAERGRTGANYLLSGTRISIRELSVLVAAHYGRRAPRVVAPLPLIRPFGGLVLRLTPADQVPLFTPESLRALRFSPTVSHFAATTELGYAVRPIHRTIQDTLDWFAAAGR